MRKKDEDEGWPCCEAVMTQLVLGEWICDRLTVGAEIMNGLTSEFAKLQRQHLSNAARPFMENYEIHYLLLMEMYLGYTL